ncbi:MAG TPA: DNA polymerase III subunit gamma/tau [Holophaga sp.]|nr:DNA polymerase III subunit gamma/tau [Holophaga sp.]
MNTLALKYRPRLLTDLVGQEASVRALTNALNRAKAAGGAIHHQAFLFAGVRGTGKTSTARILARALNCQEGPTPTPCGVCDACQASDQPDRNLDIIEIDAASRASVEDARALREQVQTRPAFCRYRVYIIDEVHMMSRSAFDALLKILEEPPAHAVFVLATTELQDVPDTIKSRVQIYPFRLIPPGLIESRLKHVCDSEGVTSDEGALRLLAEAGQGSMRDALTILDRVIAAGDGQVAEDIVREQLGIVPAVRVQAILEAILKADCAEILDQCQALNAVGTDWPSFWRELMQAFWVRMESETRRGAGPQDILRLSRMLHLLLSRERDLRDTSLPQVVVELALITAAQLPHLAPLDALARPGAAAGAGAGLPASPARSAPPPRPEAGAAARAAVPPASVPAPRPEARQETRSIPTLQPAPSHRADDTAARMEASDGLAASPASGPASNAASELEPIADPGNLEQLRKGCSEALKQVGHGLPRTLGALPHMAANLKMEGQTLHWFFPPDVRNTVQDLENEQANPHLLNALGRVLPGLGRMVITFEGAQHGRPEDVLRADPAFQRLLKETGGEVVDIRRSE